MVYLHQGWVATILNEKGWDAGSFWGDLNDLVETRLSDSSAAAAVAAEEAIALARAHFAEAYDALPAETREAVLKTIEAAYDPEKYEEQLVPCPACERAALSSGNTDVRWEADWEYMDGESVAVGAYPIVTFYPGYLRCRVCDLELDGEDQLEAAGIERSWDLEEVDPRDFYDEEW